MSGFYTRLVSGLVFPLHERLKRHDTVAVRRSMEQTQWLPAERIQALQLQRLRTMLVDVGMHVPHYRRLFESLGFNPGAVTSLEDLRRLPLLTCRSSPRPSSVLTPTTSATLTPRTWRASTPAVRRASR